jgi:hypothetical protein
MNIDEIEKFLREARAANGPSPLQDAQNCDPEDYADYGFSIFPAQGFLSINIPIKGGTLLSVKIF